jgi:hypothetical protein
MNNMEELTPLQSQALYPVLQHYTGAPIIDVFLKNEVINFNTMLGSAGKIMEDINGDWKILIEDEIVDVVERDVFQILIKPSKNQMLGDYWEKLNELVNLPLRYRSKTLLNGIISVLKEYIISSDFNPIKPIKVGSFVVQDLKGKKTIICLN